jgi:hypothetical protein
MQIFDIRSQITPSLAPAFNELVKQTQGGPSSQAPAAAYAFVKAAPYITQDLWMSRVIALASQAKDADFAIFNQLHCSGPLCAVQLYDLNARRLQLTSLTPYIQPILSAAKNAQLGLEELSLVSIRCLLLQHDLLNTAQVAYMAHHHPNPVRESHERGKGIWLGAKATVAALGHALNAVLDHSQEHLDKIGLVLLAPGGATHPHVIETAKKFRNAVLVNYSSEEELVSRLRELHMRIFIEMHGMQNPASFVETLRYGVANTQLSWAGLPESCPAPFMDGQLLDPVLAQSSHASSRAIPLRCWLPPSKTFPRILRGSALGIWASTSKITSTFLNQCCDIASETGRPIQIYTGQSAPNVGALPPHVNVVTSLESFNPAVLLDTTPISGGHSCLFALLNGIPVVTLPGAGISSRLGASILLNHGFSEGVASDFDHFKALAISFCGLKDMPHIPQQLPWEFVETLGHFYP